MDKETAIGSVDSWHQWLDGIQQQWVKTETVDKDSVHHQSFLRRTALDDDDDKRWQMPQRNEKQVCLKQWQ